MDDWQTENLVWRKEEKGGERMCLSNQHNQAMSHFCYRVHASLTCSRQNKRFFELLSSASVEIVGYRWYQSMLLRFVHVVPQNDVASLETRVGALADLLVLLLWSDCERWCMD
jgi:hypothetical protein